MDIFAGTQRYAQEVGNWYCELDEHLHVGVGGTAPIESYDGLIARATPEVMFHAKENGIPLVNVWFSAKNRDDQPGVFPDFAEVGREAARHLIERGFRQFGCLGVAREIAHRMMSDAFHEVVEEAGSQCSCAHISRLFYKTPDSWSKFQKTLDEWIDSWKPPIALFVTLNDVTSRYLVHACVRHGLKVPDDVAIITPASEPTIGLMPSPSLSSVEVDYEQIGYRAAQLLDRMINDGEVPTEHILMKPAGISARDSTDFFAVDDEVVAAAMRFIEQSAGSRIGVGDVAAAAGVSRRTLERRFEANVGRSVSAEVRRLRLLKAKRLLVETDQMVKQIAWQSGFSDSIRMNEVFAREVGMSPSEYREKLRRGDRRRTSEIFGTELKNS